MPLVGVQFTVVYISTLQMPGLKASGVHHAAFLTHREWPHYDICAASMQCTPHKPKGRQDGEVQGCGGKLSAHRGNSQ